MFRGLFSKHDDEEKDEYFETIDPVVEQRRKEKFSTPLIYDDDFKEEQKIEKKPEKKVVEKAPVIHMEKPPVKSGYQPLEVISPMRGAPASKSKMVEKPTAIKPKRRKYEDQLVPVISPYFGMFGDEKENDIEEEAVIQPVNIKTEEEIVEKPITTVEENLRNIAKIVEEEQDQLKIIEERTGEFKLDFGNIKQEEPASLIDEIDDNMSLDELMSLYEKKFTD